MSNLATHAKTLCQQPYVPSCGACPMWNECVKYIVAEDEPNTERTIAHD